VHPSTPERVSVLQLCLVVDPFSRQQHQHVVDASVLDGCHGHRPDVPVVGHPGCCLQLADGCLDPTVHGEVERLVGDGWVELVHLPAVPEVAPVDLLGLVPGQVLDVHIWI
jgi:hypothetical protein